MAVRTGLVALGLFYLVNAGWMLVAPGAWYAATPGVTATGPMNPHFIPDIGLAFMASGAGLLIGARAGAMAATIALAAATWPALHALFHIWGWLAHGFPATATVAVTEVVGVVGLAALGAGLALIRAKQEGVVP